MPLSIKAYLDLHFLANNQLEIDNFTTVISKLYIQSGNYRIGRIKVENDSKTVVWSNQTIDIQHIDKIPPKQNW
jgi:hypothetical protein